MNKSNDVGLLLIRVAVGLIIAWHGASKIPSYGVLEHKYGETLAICAVTGELAGGLGLAVGLLTRVAGLGMAAVMFYIAFHIQQGHLTEIRTGQGTAFEYPFVVGVVGLAFLFMGAGAYSLDARVFGVRGR